MRAMICVECVQHVALTVTDLGRARQFYADVLGLAEIARPDFDFAGAWFRAGEQQIHLIVHPGTLTLRGTTAIDTRDAHLALKVASYRQTLEHLRRRRVPCVERPRNKTPWSQVYVADPDGNIIELNAERSD